MRHRRSAKMQAQLAAQDARRIARDCKLAGDAMPDWVAVHVRRIATADAKMPAPLREVFSRDAYLLRSNAPVSIWK
jgi:hypothetical protein